MDNLINKGKSMLSGSGGSHGTTGTTGGQASGQQGGQDYLDKGVNAVQDKLGMDKDHKYDKYEEKATDFARGQYEKSSGKPVNPKKPDLQLVSPLKKEILL
ncbi:uncharacterized protein AB675_5891 [Cyphellophora attinorum]|uniref:Uncharacterized protein n=1 Tax=Cyphellophora attinorum TaxID=1664694 RepID=A0A0N0NKZ6_9EURO|nr:uncharacterized protein AB675_5891 [Phialophora attinorum]KPI38711.1 hypothetical protein AB675_5891 [Phialophora attinorum]